MHLMAGWASHNVYPNILWLQCWRERSRSLFPVQGQRRWNEVNEKGKSLLSRQKNFFWNFATTCDFVTIFDLYRRKTATQLQDQANQYTTLKTQQANLNCEPTTHAPRSLVMHSVPVCSQHVRWCMNFTELLMRSSQERYNGTGQKFKVGIKMEQKLKNNAMITATY